jgi:hypothetical protein
VFAVLYRLYYINLPTVTLGQSNLPLLVTVNMNSFINADTNVIKSQPLILQLVGNCDITIYLLYLMHSLLCGGYFIIFLTGLPNCACVQFVSVPAVCLLNSSRLVVRVDFIFNFYLLLAVPCYALLWLCLVNCKRKKRESACF